MAYDVSPMNIRYVKEYETYFKRFSSDKLSDLKLEEWHQILQGDPLREDKYKAVEEHFRRMKNYKK